MLWLYAWTAAPYVTRLVIESLSGVLGGRLSLASCVERLATSLL
jgi:hypothetical protein